MEMELVSETLYFFKKLDIGQSA